MITSRRKFLRGAAVVLCAPAIVRASSLMPIRMLEQGFVFSPYETRYPATLFSELAAVTRNVFLPKLYASAYQTLPPFWFDQVGSTHMRIGA